jgi:hypothetical protein
MTLATTSLFAAFDVTDKTQERDISPVLQDAIYYDLNLLGAMNVDFGSPVYDTEYIWNEEALNSDQVTISGSVTSTATSVVLVAGQGLRVHVGDLLKPKLINNTELMQVTGISTDTLTVVRSYNSTVGVSLADAVVLSVIRREQEGSDIGTDASLNATVRSNYTAIIPARDLQITGSQLARKMATDQYQDFLARQLAARAIEMKIGMSRSLLYSEKSSSAGSDTVYRSFAGLRNWTRDNSGITNSSSEAASYTQLNRDNKLVVDKGVFPDTLIIGTDLVGSISGIDSTVRRLRESDKQVGYVVQEVLLNQGNMVQVVVDARVDPGDCFLVTKDHIHMKPLDGRAMFVIAATDFVDGKKRRILGEWTVEFRNPEASYIGTNKT